MTQPTPDFDFKFDQCENYKAAVAWYQSLSGTFFRPGDDFEKLAEYAKEKWEWTESARKSIEDKADSLLKGLLGALAVVLAILKTSPDSMSPLFAIPFTLACMSAMFCLAARHPVELAEPASIRELLPLHQQIDDPGIRQAVFAASYHVAEIGVKEIIKNKSGWLDYASRLVLAAVVVTAIISWAG